MASRVSPKLDGQTPLLTGKIVIPVMTGGRIDLIRGGVASGNRIDYLCMFQCCGIDLRDSEDQPQIAK
jgi:hypothetical protein